MSGRGGRGNAGGPTLDQIAALIAEAFTQAQQHQQAQHMAQHAAPAPPRVNWVKIVSDMKVPTYNGEASPEKLETYIKELTKAFRAQEVPEANRVHIAILHLKAEADRWWDLVQAHHLADPTFNWERLIAALRARFYPTNLKNELRMEFTNLTQGNLSVREYFAEFSRLRNLLPANGDNEDDMVQKFKSNLNHSIENAMGPGPFADVAAACEVASTMELVQKSKGRKREAEDNPQQHKRGKGHQSYQGKNEAGKSQDRFKPIPPPAQGKKPYVRHYYCNTCNKDHPGVDCKGNKVECRRCKKMGHREYECYQNPRSLNYRGDPVDANGAKDKQKVVGKVLNQMAGENGEASG